MVSDLFSDDGVLVEGRGNIHKISGLWTVVVTIQEPIRPDVELWQAADDLRAIIGNQPSIVPETEETSFWIERLEAINKLHAIPDDSMDTVPLPTPANLGQWLTALVIYHDFSLALPPLTRSRI